MAGGLKKGSSNGICNNGSGQAVKCDCGCTCPDCSGVNYGSFNAAISGITVSTSCVPNTSLNQSIRMISWPTFNTFTTVANSGTSSSADGDCCTWEIAIWGGSGSSATSFNEYSGTACGGTPVSNGNAAAGYLFKISGKWIFIILGEVDAVEGAYAVFFYGEIATSSGTDCVGPTLTFSNSLTVGNYTIPSYVPGASGSFLVFGGSPAYAVGSGGTVVISP